jgi:hypothetical protein
MEVCVDGVKIMQDFAKAFAAFPKIGAPGPCFDLKADPPSSPAQQVTDLAVLARHAGRFFSRGARALDGVLDCPPAQVRARCL